MVEQRKSEVPSAQAEVVFETPCQLGEGSLWDVETERLYWVDIVANKVMVFNPANRSNLSFDTGRNVSTVVLSKNGNYLLGLRGGIGWLDPNDGKLRQLVNPEADKPGNRMNDGKCDPRGRFWVGSMVEDKQSGNGALYCMDRDLTVERKLTGIDCSNGLVWSGDLTTFFYIDTPTHQVQAYDYDVESGAIHNQRVVSEIPRDVGAPDGMTIDRDDQLWVALWGGYKVLRIDPQSGATTFEVEVPAKCVTSCAFGGERLDELFITSARIGLSPEEAQAQPLAGSLFRAKVPFRGVPSARFGAELSD